MNHHNYAAVDMNSKGGYGILHSFPFINDGPQRQQLTDVQQLQKKKAKLSHDAPLENANTPGNQIQVPQGVLHIKPTWKPVTLDEKPPFSYATMIAHAILSSADRKLTLNDIYQWISEQYPCYSIKDHRWQNSIRHNLSLQKAFTKLDRGSDTPSGKGCYWTILPGHEQQFIDNLMKHDKSITTTSNQKLVYRKKKPSHLFTIFRMTTKEEKETKQPKKRSHCHEDSDNDSAIDFDIHNNNNKHHELMMWQDDTMAQANSQDFMTPNPYIDQSLYLLAEPPQTLLDPQPSYFYDPPMTTTYMDTSDTFNTYPLFNSNQTQPSLNFTPPFNLLSEQDLFYPY